MANKEISELTVGTTPDGTELVHGVQSGNSRKWTFANFLAWWLLDEDDFSTDSATKPPSQQSVKAYVDAHGVVQRVNVQDGAVATGTDQIPADDTIPQSDEGNEVMTLAITPTNASNILEIDVVVATSNTAVVYTVAALFQDSVAGALAVVPILIRTGQDPNTLSFRHTMVAGTTSATTFKVHIGGNGAGTMTFNGWGSARKYGGVMASSITITEYAA